MTPPSRLWKTVDWLALALAVGGYLSPWIGHRSAALSLTGVELAEFARFFPQVQSGQVVIHREWFLLPPLCAAVALGLLLHRRTGRPLHAVLLLAAAALTLVTLPPYPFLLDATYRPQLSMVIGGLLLTLLTPLTGRLPHRPRALLVALLALAGILPALTQFLRLRPLVAALYDSPVGLGWGLVACIAGFALLSISAAWQAAKKSPLP